MKYARIINHYKTISKFDRKRNFFKKIINHNAMRNQPNISYLTNYIGFFPRFAGISRHKTLCFATSKPRSVFSKFKLARIAFRELAHFVCIQGVKPAYW